MSETLAAAPRVALSPLERAAWVAIVLVVAPLVRWASAGEPLWIDELHTGWVVADGLEHLVARARAGNQSPLWFLAPWLTTRLELSEWTLRLPSLVAGWAVVPATFAVARRMSGTASGGLLAAWLAAVDQKFAFYSIEARGYSAVHLLTLAHLAAFLPTVAGTSNWKSRAAWIVTGGLLFYVHYTTALVVVAEFAAAIALLGQRRARGDSMRDVFRAAAVDFVLVALACLPAIEHLRQVAAHRSDWSNALTPESPWRVFAWDTYVVAPIGAAVAFAALRRWKRFEPVAWQPSDTSAWTLACWLIVPWLLAIVATYGAGAQLLRFRYLMGAAAALPIVAALAMATCTTRGWRGVLAVALALAGLSGNSLFATFLRTGTWYAERTEDWRAVVSRITDDDPHGDWPILLAAGLVEDSRLGGTRSGKQEPNAGRTVDPRPAEDDEALVAFCRFPLRSLYRPPQAERDILPIASAVVSTRLSDVQLERIAERRGVWIVVRGDPEWGRRVVADVRRACERAGLRTSMASSESIAGALTFARVAIER